MTAIEHSKSSHRPAQPVPGRPGGAQGSRIVDVSRDLVAAGLVVLHPDAASVLRVLLDRRCRLPVPEGASPESWHVRPGSALPGLPVYRAVLACEAGRMEVAMAMDDASLEIAAATRAESRVLLFQLLLQPFLPHLRALGPQDWSLELLQLGDTGHRRMGGWLHAAITGRSLQLCVLRMDRGLVSVLRQHQRPTGDACAVLRRSVRAGVRLCLGRRWLRLNTLRSLEAGDVVLLEGEGESLEERVVHIELPVAPGDLLSARAHFESQSLVVDSPLKHMTDETPVDLSGRPSSDMADSLSNPLLIGEIELPVRFELESIAISLADLEAMSPGYVIELATPVAEAQLRIVVNGSTVGLADLVAIGGRLGARINQLNFNHDPEFPGR